MSDIQIKDNLKYTEKHEWVEINGDTATFGVSDFAQNALGDIVFLDLPAVGDKLTQSESFGTIESVKAAEDLYSPVSGEVLEINESINDKPDNVNSNPYDSWLVKIKLSDPGELDKLMDSKKYADYLKTLE